MSTNRKSLIELAQEPVITWRTNTEMSLVVVAHESSVTAALVHLVAVLENSELAGDVIDLHFSYDEEGAYSVGAYVEKSQHDDDLS